MSTVIVRLHMQEQISRAAVKSLLDKHHDRRFKQDVLDFYRQNWTNIVQPQGNLDDVMLLLALDSDMPIGMSACQISHGDKRIKHSLTVVETGRRKTGIGHDLLRAKLLMLSKYYPNLDVRSYVNKANESGVKLCQKAGMVIKRQGSKEVMVRKEKPADLLETPDEIMKALEKVRRKRKKEYNDAEAPEREKRVIDYYIFGVPTENDRGK